jgi:hypothetical protein
LGLAYYYALLREKQEDVRRLNACRTSLQGKQQEFYENEYKCLDPELSTTTWHGNHASNFQEIRESGIHLSYVDIENNQFSKVFDAIADKIASLQAEIASIRRTIARLKDDDD